MFFEFILLFAFAGVFYVPTDGADTKAIICYYERHGVMYYRPENIDVDYCTHVYYAFMEIYLDGTIQGSQDIMSRISYLKNRNGNVTLLFSVESSSGDSTVFAKVAASPAKLAAMARFAVNIIRVYKFDGLDIDWEYPGRNGGSEEDWTNYITMLRTLEEAFRPHGYLLSATVSSDPNAGLYDVPQMAEILDFINVKTYDFHGGYDGQTGANAPIDEVRASARDWMNKGIPADKLVLGLSSYGHSFTLEDPNNHGYGAPTTGEGAPGPVTGESGYLGYMEICDNGWTEGWDNDTQTPYKYHGNQWVGYDNPSSLMEKVCFAREQKMYGVMISSIDNDDINGKCGEKSALLHTLKDKPC